MGAITYWYSKYPVEGEQLGDEIETDISKKMYLKVGETDPDLLDGHMNYIDQNETNNLGLYFDAELSSADKTTLDSTVSDHTPA